MDKKDILLIVLGIVLIFSLSGAFLNGGGYGCGLGSYGMTGFGYSWMWIFMFLFAVALVLLIMWLFNQLTHKNSHERRDKR